MATRGWTYHRCKHGITGTRKRGDHPAVPVCRCGQGSWYWRAEGTPDPVTGKRSLPSQGGYATQDEAQSALTEHTDKLRRRVATSDRGHTVASWLTHWLATGRWEGTTRAGYTTHIHAHLIPHLGRIRLADLTKRDLDAAWRAIAAPHAPAPTRRDAVLAFIRSHPGGVSARDITTTHGRAGYSAARDLLRLGLITSPARGHYTAATHTPEPTPVTRAGATVDGVRRTLRSALTDAITEGLISINVAEGRFRSIPSRSHTARWWQPDDLDRFLTFTADDPDLCMWVIAAYTGLRRSELLGLRWTDVDLTSTHPGITVRQKCTALNGTHPCPICRGEHTGRILRPGSKTAAGTDRWVPLVTQAVTELVAHQAAQEALRHDIDDDHWTHHDLVFAQTDRHDDPGAPMRPGAVTKRHAALVRAAGCPKVVLHEMRHGAASNLLAAGLTMDEVRLILGHASTAITANVYVHSIRGSLAAGAQAAADLAQGAPAPGRPGRSR